MLGVKVALTGAILFIVTTVAISLIGRPMPRLWIAAPLVAGWFCSAVAAVVGLLMVVWA